MKGRHLWVLMASVIIVIGGAIVLVWPRSTTLAVHRQPESVDYPDGRVHVAVLRRRYSLATSLGLRSEAYEVKLGSGADAGYGHAVRLVVTGGDPEDLVVEWEPEGAWLIYGTGHRVFVPAESFLGGR